MYFAPIMHMLINVGSFAGAPRDNEGLRNFGWLSTIFFSIIIYLEAVPWCSFSKDAKI